MSSIIFRRTRYTCNFVHFFLGFTPEPVNCLPSTGRLAEGGHADDSDDSDARDHQEPPDDDNARRGPQVGAADKGRQRVGQGLVHVPGQYRPDAQSDMLPECRG